MSHIIDLLVGLLVALSFKDRCQGGRSFQNTCVMQTEILSKIVIVYCSSTFKSTSNVENLRQSQKEAS